MKTLKRIGLVLTMALVTVMTSCSSDDNGGGGGFSGPATGSFVNAKVNGANFSATGQVVQGAYESGNIVLQGLAVNGTNSSSMAIQLYKAGGLTVGTYNVGPDQTGDVGLLSYTTVTSAMSTVTYVSGACANASGTIEITFIDDTKIEGTFSFTGVELRDNDDCSGGTKNVTNGSFRLEL